jgi:hypothetical protein
MLYLGLNPELFVRFHQRFLQLLDFRLSLLHQLLEVDALGVARRPGQNRLILFRGFRITWNREY